MDLINSMILLAAGFIFGWFANRMVTAQSVQWADKPTLPLVGISQANKIAPEGAPRPSSLAAMAEFESLKEQFFANDSLGG